MSTLAPEFDELRVTLERLRALLENLVVRGLRACGPEELGMLGSFTEHLERAGAGHVAAALAELRGRIEKDDRMAARSLLRAQTSVRLLERLLTLRVVRAEFAAAQGKLEQGGPAGGGGDADKDEA